MAPCSCEAPLLAQQRQGMRLKHASCRLQYSSLSMSQDEHECQGPLGACLAPAVVLQAFKMHDLSLWLLRNSRAGHERACLASVLMSCRPDKIGA